MGLHMGGSYPHEDVSPHEHGMGPGQHLATQTPQELTPRERMRGVERDIGAQAYADITEAAGEKPDAMYGTDRRPAWKPAHGEEPNSYIQRLLERDPDYRAQYEADRTAGMAHQAQAPARAYMEQARELGMSPSEYLDAADLPSNTFADLPGYGGDIFNDSQPTPGQQDILDMMFNRDRGGVYGRYMIR